MPKNTSYLPIKKLYKDIEKRKLTLMRNLLF